MQSAKKTKTPVSSAESLPQISLKVTYATLGMPNPILHDGFDQALDRVRARLGQSHPMFIGGESVTAEETFEDCSPINRIGYWDNFRGGRRNTHAMRWQPPGRLSPFGAKSWKERVKVLRRAASLIEKRIYELSALTSLEVGKNRLEAIGDVQEA